MRPLLAALLLLPALALARGEPPQDMPDSFTLTSEQFNELVQTLAQEQGQDQAQRQQQTQQGIGGTAGVTNRIAYPVHAPGVAVRPGNSTAPYLKCVGLGASGSTGSEAGAATGAWCWIVRPIWWESQADKLEARGLDDQAVQARCMDKLQWKPYGSKDDCIAVETQRYIELELDTAEETASLGKPLEFSETEYLTVGQAAAPPPVDKELLDKIDYLEQEVEELSRQQQEPVKQQLLDDGSLRRFRESLKEVPRLEPLEYEE